MRRCVPSFESGGSVRTSSMNGAMAKCPKMMWWYEVMKSWRSSSGQSLSAGICRKTSIPLRYSGCSVRPTVCEANIPFPPVSASCCIRRGKQGLAAMWLTTSSTKCSSWRWSETLVVYLRSSVKMGDMLRSRTAS